MPSVCLDLEIQGVLSSGLAYVRAHPEVLNEVFERWREPHLRTLYGEAEIGRVRKWFLGTDIPVVLSWGLQNVQLPCISIHLAQDPERVEAAALSDSAGLLDHWVPQPVIVPSFVPLHYDPAGVVTAPPGVKLHQLRPGLVLVDAKGEEYYITSPIAPPTFTIDLSDPNTTPVNPQTLYIKAGPGQLNKADEAYSSRFMGHVDIGFHADVDFQTVLWLYYIIEWVLFRFKLDMERNGIQLQTFSGSEFAKDSKFLPENIYSRWMRFSAQVYVEWKIPQHHVASLADLYPVAVNKQNPAETAPENPRPPRRKRRGHSWD